MINLNGNVHLSFEFCFWQIDKIYLTKQEIQVFAEIQKEFILDLRERNRYYIIFNGDINKEMIHIKINKFG